MKNSVLFFNRCFNKTRLKNFILWFFNKYGAKETIKLIEHLKKIGFQYATKAGVSIGIDDLKIPLIKSTGVYTTEKKIQTIEIQYQKGNLTEIERRQQFVEEWNFVSEKLKRNAIQFFKATNIFNPIYMIAFSGARGNISQVRQLIGMRGLMVDPQGQILDFPIRSNFREGLNLTEYIISCYGARKGVVDTALRTATSGYLTRRLVDVTQQVIIGRQDCQTNRGIRFTHLIEGKKVLLSLRERLTGRILLEDIFTTDSVVKKKYKIGVKNQEISSRLSLKITQLEQTVLLRSPLTCHSKNSVCQLCYGWSLANSAIVSIGEAVGVLAAQSIGEPGTQLTMRTFHTGGVFTGGFIDQIYAPFDGTVDYLSSFQGLLIRTLNGQIGFLTKTEGRLQVKGSGLFNGNFKKKEFSKLSLSKQFKANLISHENIYLFLLKIKQIESKFENEKNVSASCLIFNIPIYTTLLIRQGEFIFEKTLIAELSSHSFLENRRQETEQEVFSPISGQIFFENLILLEKNTKEGIVRKMTYGLGSIWVIAGIFWNTLFNKNFFPFHGDFITISSTAQKLEILIEKPYYLDLQLSDSIQKFDNFQMHSFSINDRNLTSRFKLLDNIFLNRSLFYINCQKIYYQSFRYFVLINFKKLIPNINFFNLINFLPSYEQFIKTTHSSLDPNEQILGLNVNFNQNKSHLLSKKLDFKSNFLLWSVYFLSQKTNRKFFFAIKLLDQVKSKHKQPVVSRKIFDFKKAIFTISNQCWENFTEPINFNYEKINFLKFYNWSFYLKNKKKFKNINWDFELPPKDKISFLVIQSQKNLNKTLGTNVIKKKKILKNFITGFNFENFFIYLIKPQLLHVYERFNWISKFQPFFVLLNRQGNLNFQLLISWILDPNISNDFIFLNLFKVKDFNETLILRKKLNSNIQFPAFKKVYNIKPVLFHKKSITHLYIDQNYLVYYIIQNFLSSFCSQHWVYLKYDYSILSFLRKENIKIGFKTQFRMTFMPTLNSINYKNNEEIRSQVKTYSHFTKPFFQENIFSFLYKKNSLRLNLKKSQNFLSWVYCSPQKIFLTKFKPILKTGSFFSGGIRFDNHQIMVDIMYSHDCKYLKTYVKQSIYYHHINNLKKRFLTNSYDPLKLVLFQKTINQNTYCVDKIFLIQTLSNQSFFNFLSFNATKNYWNNFQKKSLKPQKFLTPFSFYNFTHYSTVKNRIFEKIEYLNNIYIKVSIDFNYYIFLKSYFSIYIKKEKNFIFKNLSLNNSINKNSNFLPYSVLCSKGFHFSSVKNFNFQVFQNQITKNSNPFKLFYSILNPFSFKNLITIKFFLNLKNGEIICTNQKKENTSFIILTRLNLKAFLFTKSLTFLQHQSFTIGNFIRYGDKLDDHRLITKSGQIIYIDQQKLIIRKAIPFLITSRSLINVYQNEAVEKDSRLFTFLYHRIKTGDIIQGIPKVEEFFEARATRSGLPILLNLHIQLRQLFKSYNLKLSVFESTQKSFEIIQQIIVDEIQKIYCLQGVYIADKHLEIVVRQMTSKVQIIEGGQTGLLCGELIEFDWIRLIHKNLAKEEILYEPIILGITKSCLETESFISAASFQETTRILSKAAIQNKVDFVRGLKQNVILGNLVPAGTGFFSPLYFQFLKHNKKYIRE